MAISDAALAQMRAQAKAAGGGGVYVILEDEGEFVAGVVTGIETVETSFGEVEELILADVRTNGGSIDGERRLRLSRTVLKRELGSEAEKGPVKVGETVFVEYHGTSMSKAGREFHRYSVMKWTEAPKGDPTVQMSGTEFQDALKKDLGAVVEEDSLPF